MRRARKHIRRAIRDCKKANAEVSRIHPEFATPRLLAEMQKVARLANEAHIVTLQSHARTLKRLERLAKGRSDERDDS